MFKSFNVDRKFLKDLWKIILPFVVIATIDSVISLSDQLMVGIFQDNNSHELAASSLGKRLANIGVMVTSSFVSMFSFMIMQLKGADQSKKIKDVYKITHLIILGTSLIVILLAYLEPNTIMRWFQGDNYSDPSTSSGKAQGFMKARIWALIPLMFANVSLNWLTANKEQKIIIPISFIMLVINVLFNYLFYKVFGLGLVGIAYSTLLSESTLVLSIYAWAIHKKIYHPILYNPLTIFMIDSKIFLNGLKRVNIGLQNIIWSSIRFGILIIYTRWYGDEANNTLAIVTPISGLFYFAFVGVGQSKGYFVGKRLGAGKFDEALEYDKKLNWTVFLIALTEGVVMSSLSYFIPMAWVKASSDTQMQATLAILAIAATYPIAAISKTMLNSFKVAGMGKQTIVSNGIFALIFEFGIPFVLYMINTYVTDLGLSFWELFWISRCAKLFKLPPTVYYWKKKEWLKKAI